MHWILLLLLASLTQYPHKAEIDPHYIGPSRPDSWLGPAPFVADIAQLAVGTGADKHSLNSADSSTKEGLTPTAHS